VQIAHETCRANDEINEEYSIHLVGPELNIYITKMYGTTNIKFIECFLHIVFRIVMHEYILLKGKDHPITGHQGPRGGLEV
jgi:hypothetical protein